MSYSVSLQSRQVRIIGETLPPMSALDRAGWRINGLRNRIIDRIWERRLGINTCGKVAIHQADAHFYGTFAYESIFRILRHVRWRPDDVFVDIGCGKGRVVCCAATMPLKKAVGIDLDEQLCEAARVNADRMRPAHAAIEIAHVPAQEFDYRECTKFLLFHPFGEATLERVLESIERSLRRQPREIELIYVNPAHDDLLERHPSFVRKELWQWKPWGSLKFDVSFWRCRSRKIVGAA